MLLIIYLTLHPCFCYNMLYFIIAIIRTPKRFGSFSKTITLISNTKAVKKNLKIKGTIVAAN